jgi:dTDP-4-dehydrorhamnose reductase
MLGSTLAPWLERCGHSVLRHGFRAHCPADHQADLRKYASAAAMLGRAAPDCIINLAALTDVDACERRPHEAYLMNTAIVDNICRWIRTAELGCHLVQISTDQLYDGSGPHPESDITISNIYAFSKIAGELAAACVPSTILRTNFFGRSCCPARASFSDWIYESIVRNQPISLFEDVRFSPLSLTTLSDMIERVVRKRPVGIFNLGAADGSSKADFAYGFARALDLPTTVMRRVHSSSAAHLEAYRPKDMRMDSSLFERTMDLRLPTLAEEILIAGSDYLETA